MHSLAVGAGELLLVQGDITTFAVDAILNAANAQLAGGGGVDGAIHRAGGPALMQELRARYPDGCPTGSAVITDAGRLPAKYVIHAVGPRWRDGSHGEAELLHSAYQNSFALAAEHQCESVAAPAISTGIYGFPVVLAAPIAVEAARDALAAQSTPLRAITFTLFSAAALDVFATALGEIAHG